MNSSEDHGVAELQPDIDHHVTELPAANEPAIDVTELQPDEFHDVTELQPDEDHDLTELPAADEPVTEQPASDEPVTEQPAADEPTIEDMADEDMEAGDDGCFLMLCHMLLCSCS